MGLKQLTVEQADKLADYLGLSPLEAEYLIYLAQKDRAGTKSTKEF